MQAFLQLSGLITWYITGTIFIIGGLNALFGWNLALKSYGSSIDIPSDFTEVVIITVVLAVLGSILSGLGHIDRVLDWIRSHRWTVLIGLAAVALLTTVGLSKVLPNLTLEFAIQGGNSAKAQALLQKHDYSLEVLDNLIYWSLMEEDPIVSQMMLDQGADINHRRGEHNSTLLHSAVLFMPVSATEFLLANNIDVNMKNTFDFNALHSLLKYRADNMTADEAEILLLTQQLVTAGIDTTPATSLDETPLDIAQDQGYETVVAYLKEK